MEQKHTPGTWRVTGTGTIRYIDAPVGNGMIQEVASCMRVEYGDMEANARRIVACVNACDGIPTEKLEGRTIAEYVSDEAYLQGMQPVGDGMSINLSGIACQMLAASFAGQFVGSRAVNYLEVHMGHPEIGEFNVTIQRKEGKTPGQMKAEVEQQRDQLLAAATAAYELLKVIYGETGKVCSQLQAAIAAANANQHTASTILTDAEVIAGLEEQRKELADMLREVLEGRPAGELEPMLAGIPMERYSRAIQVLERCAPQQEGGVAC